MVFLKAESQIKVDSPAEMTSPKKTDRADISRLRVNEEYCAHHQNALKDVNHFPYRTPRWNTKGGGGGDIFT